jgi:ABC-type microcin C transport system permease subunit YejE
LSFFSWSLLIRFTASDNPFGIFKLFLLDFTVSLLIRFTASDNPFGIIKLFLLVFTLSLLLRFTASDNPFGIFKLFLLDKEEETKRKRTKRQTTIYKTMPRKLKIEENEPH